MKIAVILRGIMYIENYKIKNEWKNNGCDTNYYTRDFRRCLNSLNKNILVKDKIDYDLFFGTYDNEIINEMKKKLNPVKIWTYNYNDGQITNFKNLIEDFDKFTNKNNLNYDYILISRFDVVYKKNIFEILDNSNKKMINVTCAKRLPKYKNTSDILHFLPHSQINIFKKFIINCKTFKDLADVSKYENNFNILEDDFDFTTDNDYFFIDRGEMIPVHLNMQYILNVHKKNKSIEKYINFLKNKNLISSKLNNNEVLKYLENYDYNKNLLFLKENYNKYYSRGNIAVFLGNIIYTTTPYDGLNLFNFISKYGKNDYNVDLIMFEDDLRLKGNFNNKTRYEINNNIFVKRKNLVKVKNWNELINISNNYDMILCNHLIKNKNQGKIPDLKKLLKCPIAVWDGGGIDILLCKYATYYFTKGDKWTEYLSYPETKKKYLGIEKKNVFTTGSPLFDYYLDIDYKLIGERLTKDDFNKKYNLKNEKFKKILILPSALGRRKKFNPNIKHRHTDQFKQNELEFDKLYNKYKDTCYFLIKTHPFDYNFYEEDEEYNGILKRAKYDTFNDKPLYKYLLEKYSNMTLIDSHDHYAALKNTDIIFNISGSGIAMETYFTDALCFSMNENNLYFDSVSYLPGIKLPDSISNITIDNIYDIFNIKENKNKDKLKNYISKDFSCPKILEALNKIFNK